jgi:hypothetical protein
MGGNRKSLVVLKSKSLKVNESKFEMVSKFGYKRILEENFASFNPENPTGYFSVLPNLIMFSSLSRD